MADRANIQNQTVQRDWRGLSSTRKIEEEASQKNQTDETGRGGHRSALWRTGHAAVRANIQNQTVQSDCCGWSSIWKIEEEALQKNQAHETCKGGNKVK